MRLNHEIFQGPLAVELPLEHEHDAQEEYPGPGSIPSSRARSCWRRLACRRWQVGLSRSLAAELAPHGITVNVVAPGWIPVERHAGDKPEDKQAYFAQIPMKRWGVPADVVGAVVFLASDAASFITGQHLDVNGGITIG